MSSQRCRKFGSLVILAAGAVLSNGCHSDPWAAAAHHGSLQELSKAIDAERQSRGISQDELKRMARAVAERELASATDQAMHVDDDALPIEELADCALELTTPLARRSARDDDTAGAALLSRINSGEGLSTSDWSQLTKSPNGWARAAAARATKEPSRYHHREQALSDDDSRVRRAALLSCIETPAEEHRDAVTVLLRGAPDLETRRLAARAIGVLGGDDAYRALEDTWPNAEVALRLAIVNALAQERTFASGGKARLVALARSEPGIVGVAAALSLVLGRSDARAPGIARITRTLTSGSTSELRLAILGADWSLPEQAQQLVRLGLQGEPLVRVAALSRWLERPDHVWTATTFLRATSESATTEAILARSLLAKRKDLSVAKGLREQQRYAAAEVRALAAHDLFVLGDWSSVSRALADDSPVVRLRTACLILAEPRAR